MSNQLLILLTLKVGIFIEGVRPSLPPGSVPGENAHANCEHPTDPKIGRNPLILIAIMLTQQGPVDLEFA